MTKQEVKLMMDSIGIPYAYYQFTKDTSVPPPFICFYYTGDNDLVADNQNYQSIEGLTVELYCNNKDFASEAKVEQALRAHGIVWDKSEDYISTEQLFMTTYSTEVIING